MKKLIPLLIIMTMLSTACEYSVLTVTSNINVNKTYEIDKTGAYSGSMWVYYSDVAGTLDIPTGSRIDEVSIESISIKVVVLSDNQAPGVTISGKLQLGSTAPEVFNNYFAPLVAVDNQYIGLNTLIAEGVSGIKSKLEAYLKAQDFSALQINLSGDSSPLAGKKIHTQILLRVTGTVKYSKCIWQPFLMGGDNCDF